MSWMLCDEGKTLDTRGSENGLILRDEEHTEGARITLEEEADHAPFAITCGVYGWFFHTRYLGKADLAEAEYDLMKAELSQILYALSLEDGLEWADKRQNAYNAISAFLDRYP